MNTKADPALQRVANHLLDSLIHSPTYGVWADGFYNVICRNETSSDHDNAYLPEEKIPYALYKAGAKAAESLLACQKYKYTDAHG